MKTFTLMRDQKKHKVALVSLYPQRDDAGKIDPLNYHASLGVYIPNESGRLKFAHRSLRGVIPIPELVRWAIRKGFIHWTSESEEQS